uniref:Protein zwilch n=1 Tax=Sinocyclocheilus rhinocerous TaxID=307959 RepID=A0A673LQW7_9TELE
LFQDDISVLLVEKEELLIFSLTKAEHYNKELFYSLSFTRQLLSWYTMAQNPNMPQVEAPGTLHPLWVRCDKLDLCATAWLGVETVYSGNKTSGVKLYTVSCKGPTGDETSFTTLDDLKQEHEKRHHASTVATKGYAQYNLFCSLKEESMMFESQSSVIASLTWNNVEKVLECPPLSSKASLNIKVAVGDIRSPLYQTYKEMEFLLVSVGNKLCFLYSVILMLYLYYFGVLFLDFQKQKAKTDAIAAFSSMVIERGDLDFTEQLWEKMRKSVTSYQDVTECLKIVVKAVKLGKIKPWIHKDSNSTLSKLILQSYQQQIDAMPLTGLTPANMLLELGLDKIRKDFINYLVGKELTTLNYLRYYLDTEVELQEQVMRVRKLHHLLEILGTCSTFLSLPHDRLFLFTQSCLQYYKTSNYDEDHVFQLQIKPALISYFYEKEQPFSWAMEVSSGQGSKEVKTALYLSDKPLVDHISFDLDVPLDESVNGESEKMSYYRTMVSCSLISFT